MIFSTFIEDLIDYFYFFILELIRKLTMLLGFDCVRLLFAMKCSCWLMCLLCKLSLVNYFVSLLINKPKYSVNHKTHLSRFAICSSSICIHLLNYSHFSVFVKQKKLYSDFRPTLTIRCAPK